MRVKITIDVDYDSSSVDEDDILNELDREIERAVSDGMLTGATAAIGSKM
jgi:hypothetical protein